MRASVLLLLLPLGGCPVLGCPAATAQTVTTPAKAPAVPTPARYFRLYVYTTQEVRPRHRAIVEKAIERRARAHVSAFREVDDAPLLELGPVTTNVKHWHWRGESDGWHVSTIAKRAWPFVAVLEFTREGEPKAWIDWFRRAKHSRDEGAWVKDPADQRYASHISDQTVCDHDERLGYMALVDTPTGGVIHGNEWIIRARVEWDGGAVTKRTGWWLRFRDTHLRDLGEWWAELTPLVAWVPRRPSGSRGDYSGSTPVSDPVDELSAFDATTVFTLPRIPDDVTPCRG